MKGYLSSGNMPHKLNQPLHFQNAFNGLTENVLKIMFELLKGLKQDEYPYSGYSCDPDTEGNSEHGIQLVIEADIFSTDQIILRRHLNGYTVVIISIGENMGTMEYEFLTDDPLTELIPIQVQEYMEENYF